MDTEQDIVNFCDITGASTEVAKNFLQVKLLIGLRVFVLLHAQQQI